MFLLTAGLSLAGPDSSYSPDGRQAESREQTGLTGLKADLKIILQDRFGRSSSSERRLYKSEMLVRMEPESPGPLDSNGLEGRQEVNPPEDIYIYDYTQRKQYRLIPSSKIYFETAIPQAGLVEAQREGLMALQESPTIETRKIKLAEATFDGNPCLLYLQVRSLMTGEGSKKKRLAAEYSLIWEATDLGNFPVRIVYTNTDFVTKIIEYRNTRLGPIDGSLFQLPKGFRSLTPF